MSIPKELSRRREAEINIMRSDTEVVDRITSSLSGGVPFGGGNFGISQQLYEQLRDPHARIDLVRRLREQNEGCRFEVTELSAPGPDTGPLYSLTVRVIRPGSAERGVQSEVEIVDRITDVLSNGVPYTGGSFSITRQAYERLQDPRSREDVISQLEAANPGYRFTIFELSPPSEETGDFYTLGINASRGAFRPGTPQSETAIIDSITKTLSANVPLSGSSNIISEHLYLRLQDQEFRERFLRQLEGANPGYAFSIRYLTPPSEAMGPFYTVDVSISRTEEPRVRLEVSSQNDFIRDISSMLSAGTPLTGVSRAISPELYLQLQSPDAREAFLRNLELGNPGHSFAITELSSPEESGDPFHILSIRISGS